MLRDDLEVELHVERRPDASGAWARLFAWLLSEDENDPDEAVGNKRGDDREGDNHDD